MGDGFLGDTGGEKRELLVKMTNERRENFLLQARL